MQIPTPISGDLSLYFHLPFCEKKCDYCHFFVLPNKSSYKEELLKALLIEIELKAPEIKKSRIQSIYFGGGTPALVGPKFIQTLLDKLQVYTFLGSIEITLELNPENTSYELLKGYHEVGINRLSLGAQSFNDAELHTLSRSHTAAQTLQAIKAAKDIGFNNISIDLMYDLPNQSLKSWIETCHIAADLPITHLSLYNLTIEPHTVFYKYRQKIEALIPKERLSLKMYQSAIEIFEKNGLFPYEISAFCKKDYYSRHNVGYWMQRNHLGFGPSAFSLLNGTRFQNVKNLNKYTHSIKQNELPIDFTETLEKDSFLRESLAIALRLYQGIETHDFQSRFGLLSKDLQMTLKSLQNKNWIEMNERQLLLTNEGRLYHDALASDIVA